MDCISRSSFLDAVVSDVIMFQDQKLTVFPGSVSDYIGRMSEKADHMSRLYAAKMTQERRFRAFIASAQQSTSKKPGKAKFIDPKKQKAGKCSRMWVCLVCARACTVSHDGSLFACRRFPQQRRKRTSCLALDGIAPMGKHLRRGYAPPLLR